MASKSYLHMIATSHSYNMWLIPQYLAILCDLHNGIYVCVYYTVDKWITIPVNYDDFMNI